MNSTITVIGRKKMAQARAGVKALPKIAGMAFGTGAVQNGEVQPPGETLFTEELRKEIDGYTAVSDTCYRFMCTLEKDELVDKTLNEIALYDTEGDIVAIKTFTNKSKDSDMQMIFEIDDQF